MTTSKILPPKISSADKSTWEETSQKLNKKIEKTNFCGGNGWTVSNSTSLEAKKELSAPKKPHDTFSGGLKPPLILKNKQEKKNHWSLDKILATEHGSPLKRGLEGNFLAYSYEKLNF